jgi:hypothetical protein
MLFAADVSVSRCVSCPCGMALSNSARSGTARRPGGTGFRHPRDARDNARSSAIRRKPDAVPGDGLVMSSRTRVVVTGSKVSVVGCPDAVAHEIVSPLTGTKAFPFQYDAVISAGRLRAPPVTNVAAIAARARADAQASDTHSVASDELTAGRFAVADLS